MTRLQDRQRRLVLVPGTRRATPLHPLSMAAAAYRRDVELLARHGIKPTTPAVVTNARRRARKAARR